MNPCYRNNPQTYLWLSCGFFRMIFSWNVIWFNLNRLYSRSGWPAAMKSTVQKQQVATLSCIWQTLQLVAFDGFSWETVQFISKFVGKKEELLYGSVGSLELWDSNLTISKLWWDIDLCVLGRGFKGHWKGVGSRTMFLCISQVSGRVLYGFCDWKPLHGRKKYSFICSKKCKKK